MITGFNTDIEYGDRVYHVQTEDKGVNNPVVESLIYCGGEIVTSRRSSYEDLAASGKFSEQEVLHRMEQQHQRLIREIKMGKFSDGPRLPAGHNIVSSRSFDEVVEDFLHDQNGRTEALRIKVLDWQVFEEGTRPTMRLTVRRRDGDTPCAGARVCIRLESANHDPVELFSSEADGQGFVEASFEIPEDAGEAPAIVCEASTETGREQMRQRIKKSRRSPQPA